VSGQVLIAPRVGDASRKNDDAGQCLADEDFGLVPVSTESDRWLPRTCSDNRQLGVVQQVPG
jgi:hypothetical protein